MKDVILGFGGMLAYLGLRAASLAWSILKAFLGFFLVLGATVQILEEFDFDRFQNLAWYERVWPGLLELGDQVAQNWMPVAVLMLFFWVLTLKRRIMALGTDVSHIKIGMVATMNFLEIEVRTDGMKQLHDEGFLNFLKLSFGLNVWGTIFGNKNYLTDDALTAKPVRNDIEVSLREDLESRG